MRLPFFPSHIWIWYAVNNFLELGHLWRVEPTVLWYIIRVLGCLMELITIMLLDQLC